MQTIVQGVGVLLFVACTVGYLAGRSRTSPIEQVYLDALRANLVKPPRLVRTQAQSRAVGGSPRGGRVSGPVRLLPCGGGGASRFEREAISHAREEAVNRDGGAGRAAKQVDMEIRLAFASSMSRADWGHAHRRGVIIHEGIALEDLVVPFYEALDAAGLLARYEEPVGACWQTCLGHEASVGTLVQRINAVLPRDRQFRKALTIRHPHEAELYVLT